MIHLYNANVLRQQSPMGFDQFKLNPLAAAEYTEPLSGYFAVVDECVAKICFDESEPFGIAEPLSVRLPYGPPCMSGIEQCDDSL